MLNINAQDKNSGTKNLKQNGIHEAHKFDPKRDAQKDIDNAIVKAKNLIKESCLMSAVNGVFGAEDWTVYLRVTRIYQNICMTIMKL